MTTTIAMPSLTHAMKGQKVLQAAGRVIRTVEDVGIVALLDERFLTSQYLRMFPREWDRFPWRLLPDGWSASGMNGFEK